MESLGLTAHAAAPLAICELVARLCLCPLRIPPVPREDTHKEDRTTTTAPEHVAKKGKGKNKVTPKEAQGALELIEQEADREVSPALALVCLRRSRLLLKLGPT